MQQACILAILLHESLHSIKPEGKLSSLTQDVNRWVLSGFGDEISSDPEVQLAVLGALGASAIEVRSAWDTNIVNLDQTQLRRLKSILDEEGFRVSAIGSPIGKVGVESDLEAELERARAAISAAHFLDTRLIRIFSFYPVENVAIDHQSGKVLDRMEKLVELAEREEVTLLHENEKGIYGDIPERVLEIHSHLSSSSFSLAWDSANFVQVGVTDIQGAWDMLADRVSYLQVKDAMASDGSVVPAGEGDGGMQLVIEGLVARGYQGFASMEPHLSSAFETGGFSGPRAFGIATRAFRSLAEASGVELI